MKKRAKKRKTVEPRQPDIVDKTRAAVALCNAMPYDEGLKMQAFLAMFHPELSDQKQRELVSDAKNRYRR